jgi:PAS domain S-box-containing protein
VTVFVLIPIEESHTVGFDIHPRSRTGESQGLSAGTGSVFTEGEWAMRAATQKILTIVALYVTGASVWIFFSDRLLVGIDSRDELVELATLKGVLFVALTGALLFFALQHFARPQTLGAELPRPKFWTPILVLLGVTLTTAVVAHLAYRAEQEAISTHFGEDLGVRAHAEARAVATWIESRRMVGVIAGRNAVAGLSGAATAGEPPDCRRLGGEVADLVDRFGFAGFAVVDGDGVRRCASGLAGAAGAIFERFAADTTEPPRVDIRRGEDGRLWVTLATAIPKTDGSSGAPAVLAVFELPFDRDFALPLFRPEGGGTVGATLLVDRSGPVDRVIHVVGANSVDPAEWDLSSPADASGVRRILRHGEILVARSARIAGTPFAVVGALRDDAAHGGIDRLATTTGISLLVAFGASLFLAFVAWQRQWLRGALVEVAQRRRAEQAEDLFRATFETVGVGIVQVAFDGRWIRVNPAFEAMSGYPSERLAKLPVVSIFAADDRAGMRRSLARLQSGEVERISAERRLMRADGGVLPVAITASVVRSGEKPFFVAAVEDLTPRLEAERAVMRVEASKRLEALGRMTGGIAHDFNNLLTVVSGNLQLLEMSPTSPKAGQWVAEALRAAEAGSKLNHRLTTFARQRRFAATRTDLAERILGMLEVLRRTVGPTIRLTVVTPEEPAIAWVDPTEVDNAILNLVFNARDAMPGGGEITIEIRTVRLEKGEDLVVHDDERSEFVEVSVADTGTGMTPEVKARAFEPFFTTKEAGRGTGLGLATLHGFVRQVGGFVTLDSELGKGTRVTLRLPRAPRARLADEAAERREPMRGAGERILVVEDDPDVARVTHERLLALGYDVVSASDGRSALDTLRRDPSIALVFSDIVMPGEVSGIDLAEKMVADASRPVVLTSGHTFDGERLDEIEQMGVSFLKKPYTQFELSVTLREALVGRGPDPT